MSFVSQSIKYFYLFQKFRPRIWKKLCYDVDNIKAEANERYNR